MSWAIVAFVTGGLIGYFVGVRLRLEERIDEALRKRQDELRTIVYTWHEFDQSGDKDRFEQALKRRH